MSDEQTVPGAPEPKVDEAKRALRDEMRGVREERRVAISQFELREVPNGAGGTNLKFEGYASVTCSAEDDFTHAYEMEDWLGPYTESVLRGAFSTTLAAGADVAFLVNHGGVTMARTKANTLRLFEDLVGLNVDATLNPVRSDVQILRAAVEDQAVDEMSFAFRVVRQKWSYEEDNGVIDRRFLQELNLDKGDVSPVNYGANPHTGGLVSMRSAMGALLSGRGLTCESWIAALREIRAGKAISKATFEALQPVHDYLMQGDDHAETLADLLDLKDDGDDGDGAASASGSEALSLALATLPNHGEDARTRLAGLRR
jgi:uncharacterized protein